MGRCRRARPRLLEDFHELSLLNRTEPRNCFEYEEAYLPDSDARFVMQWILRGRGIDNPALNYCAARGGHFERDSREWRLDVEDLVLGRQMTARAKLVVNAAGVWTDAVNDQFGIDTPYKHILSKGVFIGIPRHPSHQTPLIFAGEGERDCFSLIPWGPIALWGPTETLTADTREGLAVSIGDVRMLLEELNRHLARPVQPDDIVSFRCGIRGLAVRRSTHNVRHSLHLSRKYVVHRDGQAPWISIHGGKLTSCVPIAHAAADAIRRSISPTGMPLACPNNRAAAPELEAFPGLEERVPSAQWCANESCWTLEDYLRRRTNIAQWVSRGGLGGANENAARLEHLAAVFTHGDSRDARAAVHAYQKKIETAFDRVVAGCAEDWGRVSQPIPLATPLEEAI
jgi:glycerol-3-phosphate dehydrogenase